MFLKIIWLKPHYLFNTKHQIIPQQNYCSKAHSSRNEVEKNYHDLAFMQIWGLALSFWFKSTKKNNQFKLVQDWMCPAVRQKQIISIGKIPTNIIKTQTHKKTSCCYWELDTVSESDLQTMDNGNYQVENTKQVCFICLKK